MTLSENIVTIDEIYHIEFAPHIILKIMLLGVTHYYSHSMWYTCKISDLIYEERKNYHIEITNCHVGCHVGRLPQLMTMNSITLIIIS